MSRPTLRRSTRRFAAPRDLPAACERGETLVLADVSAIAADVLAVRGDTLALWLTSRHPELEAVAGRRTRWHARVGRSAADRVDVVKAGVPPAGQAVIVLGVVAAALVLVFLVRLSQLAD
jgi:hypothetical protein